MGSPYYSNYGYSNYGYGDYYSQYGQQPKATSMLGGDTSMSMANSSMAAAPELWTSNAGAAEGVSETYNKAMKESSESSGGGGGFFGDFFKGIVKGFENLLKSLTDPKALLMMAAMIALCILFPPLGTALMWIGGGLAAMQVMQGVASGNGEQAGEGAFNLGLAVIGGKSASAAGSKSATALGTADDAARVAASTSDDAVRVGASTSDDAARTAVSSSDDAAATSRSRELQSTIDDVGREKSVLRAEIDDLRAHETTLKQQRANTTGDRTAIDGEISATKAKIKNKQTTLKDVETTEARMQADLRHTKKLESQQQMSAARQREAANLRAQRDGSRPGDLPENPTARQIQSSVDDIRAEQGAVRSEVDALKAKKSMLEYQKKHPELVDPNKRQQTQIDLDDTTSAIRLKERRLTELHNEKLALQKRMGPAAKLEQRQQQEALAHQRAVELRQQRGGQPQSATSTSGRTTTDPQPTMVDMSTAPSRSTTPSSNSLSQLRQQSQADTAALADLRANKPVGLSDTQYVAKMREARLQADASAAKYQEALQGQVRQLKQQSQADASALGDLRASKPEGLSDTQYVARMREARSQADASAARYKESLQGTYTRLKQQSQADTAALADLRANKPVGLSDTQYVAKMREARLQADASAARFQEAFPSQPRVTSSTQLQSGRPQPSATHTEPTGTQVTGAQNADKAKELSKFQKIKTGFMAAPWQYGLAGYAQYTTVAGPIFGGMLGGNGEEGGGLFG